ncbi:hypothetical protein TRAPUB_9706 [Trametes pubescens]|uniref:Uncharacterized protein n=1 Tax=Trametes pubescens TaxID=154538 RepID=A0A1M2W1L4_TRAPU|nr:hypothetical protein TRAPUB_9706 [Trametes pubescens]
MDFVPSPPVGLVKVVLRKDCRYGWVDPIQWPQVLVEEYEYLCAVQKPVPLDHRLSPVWWAPDESDFERIEGSTIKCLGLLRKDSVRPLSNLVDDMSVQVKKSPHIDDRLIWLDAAMRHARDRLHHFPCTYRDTSMQVRETQRYWLMCRAFLDYYDMYSLLSSDADGRNYLNHGLMGAFTTDPDVVQRFYAAGIPVWWMRQDVSISQDTVIQALVSLTGPTDVCMEVGMDNGTVLWHGISGHGHLAAIGRGGHTFRDISRAPLLAVYTDNGYLAPQTQKSFKGSASSGPSASSSSRTANEGQRAGGGKHPSARAAGTQTTPYKKPHGSQIRGRNKFEHFEHAYMPPALEAWQHAMACVDLSHPARPSSEIWGYWTPEPALFLAANEDRANRYFMNWLRLRTGWLYLLRIPDVRVTSLPGQWWRDVLYGEVATIVNDTTRNGRRAIQIRQAFGEIFADSDYDLASTTTVDWHWRRITTLNKALCPAIIWELCELGFRHELLALDRLLVPRHEGSHAEETRDELLAHVFPDASPYCVTTIPTEGVGLSAELPYRRAPYLEGLRNVLSRWPRSPNSIHAAVPITTALSVEEIVRRERELIAFYVQTFFEQSGRAPIIPTQVPQ